VNGSAQSPAAAQTGGDRLRLRRLPLAGLAGPPAIPLLGPMGSMMRFFSDPIRSLLDLSARGDVVAMADGDASLVCAFGAAHNKAVLSDPWRFENVAESPIPVPPGSAPARILGNALTSLNGEHHKSRRRMMMPIFAKSAVEMYREAVATEIEKRVSHFAPEATVDVARASTELSLAVAMRCLFGLDPDDAGGLELARLSVGYLEGLIDPRAMIFPFRLPGTPYARFMDTAAKLEARILTLIAERRAGTLGRDVLSLLIRAHDDDGSTMSDVELVAQASVFFVAGFETTANTLAWTLFLLSQHDDVLDEVQAELDDVLGGRVPEAEEIAKLRRLDAVVHESMRVLPATPFLFMRRATEAFELGAHQLPAGAILFLSSFITHRDPAMFPEPGRFRPSRWEGLSPGPYAYIPFGAGPRLCIGSSFAAQTTRLALAAILQRARPVLLDGANISRRVRGIVLGTKHGIPMRFVPRAGRTPAGRARGDIHELVVLPR